MQRLCSTPIGDEEVLLEVVFRDGFGQNERCSLFEVLFLIGENCECNGENRRSATRNFGEG
jgi:hypothetical protein